MTRLWVVGVCCLTGVAMADEPNARTLVERANVAYANENYATALEGYRQAEVTLPESPELAYDRGLAHYKLGEFAEARDYFNRSLRTRDLGLEAKAKFNLGNVAYASALEKLSDFQEAIDLLKTAMGRYRDTLELTPDDEDAKANIQTAHLLIKDLLDKLKKQQEEQEKQQGDQDQEQQDGDQQQDGNPQDKDQDQEGKEQDGQEKQEGDGEQEENGEQQEPQEEEQQDNEAQGQQEQEIREMTRDEAERLLQSVRDRERQRREDRARRVRARWVPVRKDW